MGTSTVGRGRLGGAPVRAVAALAFLVIACTDPADRTAEGATEDTMAAPEAAPGGATDTLARTDTVSGWTAGIVERPAVSSGVVLLTSVETGRHEGFDRVVFGFADGRLPGHHLEYVDRPVRRCGSGEPVPLPGDGWLEVRLLDARAHTEEGEATVARGGPTPDLGLVRELALICDFEGRVTWVLAVASPNRYRVLQLREPARLVVDVRR